MELDEAKTRIPSNVARKIISILALVRSTLLLGKKPQLSAAVCGPSATPTGTETLPYSAPAVMPRAQELSNLDQQVSEQLSKEHRHHRGTALRRIKQEVICTQ